MTSLELSVIAASPRQLSPTRSQAQTATTRRSFNLSNAQPRLPNRCTTVPHRYSTKSIASSYID
jgi:hypothetical protein